MKVDHLVTQVKPFDPDKQPVPPAPKKKFWGKIKTSLGHLKDGFGNAAGEWFDNR